MSYVFLIKELWIKDSENQVHNWFGPSMKISSIKSDDKFGIFLPLFSVSELKHVMLQ